jgi:hypothetical protein
LKRKFLPARAASAAITISAAVTAAAAAAGTTASTTARPTPAAAAVATFGARASLVHGDGASTQIAAIQCFDSRIALSAVGHFNESESTQASTKLVTNQIHFSDSSILSKSLSQIVFTGTEGEISHVDIQASVRPFGIIKTNDGPQSTKPRERLSKQVFCRRAAA